MLVQGQSLLLCHSSPFLHLLRQSTYTVDFYLNPWSLPAHVLIYEYELTL